MIEKYRETWNKMLSYKKIVAGNYIKIKNNSDDDLPLNRLLFLSDAVILFRSAVNDGAAYYPKVFLEKAFHDKKNKLASIIDFLRMQ